MMRNSWWVLAGLLVWGWPAPLRAQVRDNSAILGVNQQNLPFTPVNPTLVGTPPSPSAAKAASPPAASRSLRAHTTG